MITDACGKGPSTPVVREDAVAALRRAGLRVGSCVGDDGAIRERCRSRTLESALLATLLRQTGTHERCRAALLRYLRTREPETSVDRLVISAVLRDRPCSPTEFLSCLDDFRHFTADRKRLMFRTILAILTDAPDHDWPDADGISYGGSARWVDLSLCASKVLAAHGQGRPGIVSDADKQFLLHHLEFGSARAVWEGHLLAHVLALLAAQRFAPGCAVLEDGIKALIGQQNPDGGVPFIAGFEIFCTATAALALSSGDADSDLLARMGDYLVECQQPDGGWAYAEHVRQTDVDDTAYSLQFLRRVQTCRTDAIGSGERYLTAIANPDGGMPTFRRGHCSESTMTAGALEALAPNWSSYATVCRNAVGFLLRSQREDGTFERSWSLSEPNAIFRVVSALRGVPHGQRPDDYARVISHAGGYLRDSQNPDGGWGHRTGHQSDAISTSYALLTLSPERHRSMIRAGVGCLLANQRADGGFSSIPDQAAPRPIPYDNPVIADIFGLWALNHVVRSRSATERSSNTGAGAPL